MEDTDDNVAAAATGNVKPVANAIAIIRFMIARKEGAKLTEIARTVDINPSTCLAILRTLVAQGILSVNQNTKVYAIGNGMIGLANMTLSAVSVEERVRGAMEAIAKRFRVTLSLWRAEHEDRLRLVMSAASDGNISIQMRIGQRLPRYVAAVGRLMAANGKIGNDRLMRQFGELKWQSPMKFETYLRQVETARRKGYAIDNGQFAHGVFSIAVPLWYANGELTEALSATMFAGQQDKLSLPELVADMKKVAEISSTAPAPTKA